jgi:hypothetical protein
MRMVGQISALSKWLKSRGTDLVLVPIPRAVELYPSSSLRRKYLSLASSPHLRFLIAELLRANVEVLDLFPTLTGRRRRNGPKRNWLPSTWDAKKAPALYTLRPAEFKFGGYYV